MNGVVRSLLDEVIDYIDRNIYLYNAILFGSYAKNCENMHSDIDLLLIFNELPKEIDFINMLNSFRKRIEIPIVFHINRSLYGRKYGRYGRIYGKLNRYEDSAVFHIFYSSKSFVDRYKDRDILLIEVFKHGKSLVM